ncbi:hypothetical protein [Clostridium grantii]|uniref:Uncharacterized protein n=1 Tax=Clostridium grantii DSM 8605 TaxID=1121316 RepID=A0A1M5X3K5_9CLOT|nr:hypothetical protein [Clostridium grantii]SHH94389.1 hypothetical protein SAMN02745207_03316 [Clostridium grantii DSM 8605]
MSHYNTEYENYYRNLTGTNTLEIKGKKTNNKLHLGSGIGSNKSIGKRIIQEFAGTLILFLLVIASKSFSTPRTISTYNYCKTIVNESYDFKAIELKAQEIISDPSKINITSKIEIWLNNLKSKTLEIEPILNNIKEKFNLSSDSLITYIEYKENLFLVIGLSGVIN